MTSHSSQRILAVSASLVVSTSAYASTPSDVCLDAYSGALTEIEYKSSNLYELSTTVRNVCATQTKKNSAAFSGSLEAVIKGVPLLGEFAASYNISNDKKFCEFFDKYALVQKSDTTYSRKPIPAALENLNECLKIAGRSNVAITHRQPTPGSVGISFEIPDNVRFIIEGIRTEGGFQCAIPKDRVMAPVNANSVVEVDRSFTMMCARDGDENDEGTYFKPGLVMIGSNSDAPYIVNVNEDTIYGLASRAQSKKTIEGLETAVNDLEQRIDQVRVTSHRFYFANSNVGLVLPSIVGKRYTCAQWKLPREQWEPIVKGDFCADADGYSVVQNATYNGGLCGFTHFTMACRYTPKE